MKRIAFFSLEMIVGVLAMMPSTAMAQTNKDDVFIKIVDDNLFSRCFTVCDANGDGIVTYGEAAEAKTLVLDAGGRSNIIEKYDFLKYFPNLTTFSIGNTTVESIDLSKNPKLERLNLANGLWVKEITLAVGCEPQIFFPDDTHDIVIKRVEVKE